MENRVLLIMAEDGLARNLDDVTVGTGGNGVIQGRTPQSAASSHGKGKTASRGRIYNNRLASAHGQYYPSAGSSSGYCHPHGNDWKLTSNEDDKARYTVKQIDHDEIGELSREQDTVLESQRGACYQPTKMETEAVCQKKEDIANDSRKARGKTAKISVDQPRAKESRRKNSQGKRGLQRHHGGNNEFTPLSRDSHEFCNDLTMQERVIHKSKISTKMDSSSSIWQPNFNYSKHGHRSKKLDKPDGRQKGQKGETTAIKTGKRGNIRDYRRQKEEVLRTLSYLNPLQSSQASVLIEQLRNETYECMVCCERIRCSAAVWNCCSCYHLFHMGCVRKWAKSSVAIPPEGISKIKYDRNISYECTLYHLH